MTTDAAKATPAPPTIRVVDTRFPAATAGVAASLIRVPPIADLVSVLCSPAPLSVNVHHLSPSSRPGKGRGWWVGGSWPRSRRRAGSDPTPSRGGLLTHVTITSYSSTGQAYPLNELVLKLFNFLQTLPISDSANFREFFKGEVRRISILRIPVNRGAATLYLPSSSSPQCVRACAGGSAGESPDPPERPAGSLEAEGIRRSRRSTAYRHPRRPAPGPHAPRQPTRPRTPARQCCPR